MDEEVTIADVLEMILKNIAEPQGLEVDSSLRNAFDPGPIEVGINKADAVLFRIWRGGNVNVIARIYLVGERVSVRHLITQEQDEDLSINDPDLSEKLEKHIELAKKFI